MEFSDAQLKNMFKQLSALEKMPAKTKKRSNQTISKLAAAERNRAKVRSTSKRMTAAQRGYGKDKASRLVMKQADAQAKKVGKAALRSGKKDPTKSLPKSNTPSAPTKTPVKRSSRGSARGGAGLGSVPGMGLRGKTLR